jgi:hypothetical protein
MRLDGEAEDRQVSLDGEAEDRQVESHTIFWLVPRS